MTLKPLPSTCEDHDDDHLTSHQTSDSREQTSLKCAGFLTESLNVTLSLTHCSDLHLPHPLQGSVQRLNLDPEECRVSSGSGL